MRVRIIGAIALAVVVTLSAVAQDSAKPKVDTDKIKAALQANIDAAQKKAMEREAMAATNALSSTNEVERIRPSHIVVKAPFYDTNAASPVLGHHIDLLEEHFPGISTNFTAEQRAMKSSKPVVRATIINGQIVRISTNYPNANQR